MTSDTPGRPFHSVTLDSEKCKGCINCIKRCPTQAIRVRNGKAQIINERCIDCGECIRVCQNHAKLPLYDPLTALGNYKYTIALPAPALYGQFNNLSDIDVLLKALKAFGFDDVFEVAKAAELISDRTRALMREGGQRVLAQDGGLQALTQDGGPLPRPLISSACPAVVRLIRVRFPGLVKHLLPLNAPVECAARLALKKITAERPDLLRSEIGIVFISPCAAKVTAARNALGNRTSEVDAVFAIKDIYPKLLPLMKQAAQNENGCTQNETGCTNSEAGSTRNEAGCTQTEADCTNSEAGSTRNEADCTRNDADCTNSEAGSAQNIASCTNSEAGSAQSLVSAGRMGISWCGSGGESSALLRENCLAADGIENVTNVLENLEDEKLGELDFIELNACAAGCVGGVLTVENPYIAITRIKKLRRFMPVSLNHYSESQRAQIEWGAPILPIQVLNLSDNYHDALNKMYELTKLCDELPGLDCGSCGAPTCEALAEDVVRGVAVETDCIFKLRDYIQYLMQDMQKLERYIPPPFRPPGRDQ